MSLGMNTRTTSQSVTVAIVLSILSTLWLLPANRCCCFADSSAQMYPLKILAIPTYDPDLPPLMNLTVLPLTKKQVKLPRAKKASAYLLTTTEALSVVLPTTTSTGCYKSEYDFRPPDANPVNCAQRKFVRTTQQAAQNRCVFATNGGPFHQDGSSVGVVIANGRTVTAEYGGSGNVGFGVAHQQPNERRARATKQRWWVIGSINNAEQAATLGLQQFVTGFNWLVYDGKAVANQFNDTTGASEAPRTAIGVNRNGQLMLLVADGCELWYVKLISVFFADSFASTDFT